MTNLQLFMEVLTRNGIQYEISGDNRFITITFHARDGIHHKDFYYNGKQVSAYKPIKTNV